jgi:diguanylate cyclase (GGDEF)-like protein/PAS domain S-box-containing protein
LTTPDPTPGRTEEPDASWFRELAEASGDFFFRLRLAPTRSFEYLGGPATVLFGFTSEELLESTDVAEEVILPEDLATVHEQFSQHGSGDIDTDLRWRHRDGHVVHAHVIARRHVRPDGSHVLEGIARDVTALRTAQERLREEHQRYRALAETMADVVNILDLSTWNVTYISPSITALSGYSTDEVRAMPFGAAFSPEQARDFRAQIEASLAEVKRGDRAIGEPRTIEVPHRHKDGTLLWLEITSHFHCDPSTGQWELWSAARDITRRRLAVEALEESERRYRMLAEHASDVVILRGSDGTVRWVSPSVRAVLGWNGTDLLGQPTDDYVHPDDLPTARALPSIFGQEEPQADALLRIRTAAGPYLYMSVSSRSLAEGPDSGSDVVGLRDVDELVRHRLRAERDEEILRAMNDARIVPQMLVTAARDDAGRVVDLKIVQANRAFCDYLGRAPEHILGSCLLDIEPNLAGSSLFTRLVAGIESGEPVHLQDVLFESVAIGSVRRFNISAARVGDGLTIDWSDVTDRYEAAARIAESERRYRLLAENTMDVIVHYNERGVEWVSPNLLEALGWRSDEWVGSAIDVFVHPADLDSHTRNARSLLAGKPVIARYRLRAKDTRYHWVETHAKPFYDESGKPDGIVASFRTIDLEIRAEEELERRARYDDLTGVLKRNEALQRLAVRGGSRRDPGEHRAVLFIDVDGLKQINDTHGHRAGDTALRTLALRIAKVVRDEDPIARMGGDEFLVILEGVHDTGEAYAIAEKIRAACATPIVVAGEILTVTVSVGVTLVGPLEHADEVVARADLAMYAAKQEGRNQVRVLDEIVP